MLGESAMCEECIGMDRKLERCFRLQKSVTDSQFLMQLQELIDELELRKLELHPEIDDG